MVWQALVDKMDYSVLTIQHIYTINGNFIKHLSRHKDLGVKVSSDFSWKVNIAAEKKISAIVCMRVDLITLLNLNHLYGKP